MINLVNKLKAIELKLSQEKGSFKLFGLFLRSDVENKWDILVSANWIGDERKKFLDTIVTLINSEVEASELTDISRLIILNPDEPIVRTINTLINVEHGDVVFNNNIVGNIRIEKAIIITSRK